MYTDIQNKRAVNVWHIYWKCKIFIQLKDFKLPTKRNL